MSKLIYGIYPPGNVDPVWECVSMAPSGAADILCNHTVPSVWGRPHSAVAWFDNDDAAQLRLLVAEYPNGRRAILRLRPDGNWNITMTTIPMGPAANWPAHYTKELTA